MLINFNSKNIFYSVFCETIFMFVLNFSGCTEIMKLHWPHLKFIFINISLMTKQHEIDNHQKVMLLSVRRSHT